MVVVPDLSLFASASPNLRPQFAVIGYPLSGSALPTEDVQLRRYLLPLRLAILDQRRADGHGRRRDARAERQRDGKNDCVSLHVHGPRVVSY